VSPTPSQATGGDKRATSSTTLRARERSGSVGDELGVAGHTSCHRAHHMASFIRIQIPELVDGVFALTAPLTFGRDPASIVRVDASEVSRHHAVLELVGERQALVLRDRGSTNGTRVRGVRLGPDEAFEFPCPNILFELGRVEVRGWLDGTFVGGDDGRRSHARVRVVENAQ
jgi:hypothetical protein